MKKALITGIGGFVGGYLTDYLLSKKISVIGFTHPNHFSPNTEKLKQKIHLIECDVLDKNSVDKYLKNLSLHYVFHLAAFSSPPKSWENPKETLENNIIGQLNILEALAKKKSTAKILIIGSADEYGHVDEKNLPINESTPLNPDTPYAVSKVAQDLLGKQFFLHFGLKIIRVRPFNHTGPGQSTEFVIPAFAKQIAQIEQSGIGEIKVGNLNTYRDFTDVRDMVKAYLLALEKCKFGDVYNIGSGKSYKISDILKKLISLSSTKIKVVRDKKLIRSIDTAKKYCDYSKFHAQTGWKVEIPIEKTLSDTINYERNRLSQSVKSKSKV